MNLEDKRWFALLSCFFIGSVTGMQYAFSVYSDALKDKYDLKQSEVRNDVVCKNVFQRANSKRER